MRFINLRSPPKGAYECFQEMLLQNLHPIYAKSHSPPVHTEPFFPNWRVVSYRYIPDHMPQGWHGPQKTWLYGKPDGLLDQMFMASDEGPILESFLSDGNQTPLIREVTETEAAMILWESKEHPFQS